MLIFLESHYILQNWKELLYALVASYYNALVVTYGTTNVRSHHWLNLLDFICVNVVEYLFVCFFYE